MAIRPWLLRSGRRLDRLLTAQRTDGHPTEPGNLLPRRRGIRPATRGLNAFSQAGRRPEALPVVGEQPAKGFFASDPRQQQFLFSRARALEPMSEESLEERPWERACEREGVRSEATKRDGRPTEGSRERKFCCRASLAKIKSRRAVGLSLQLS